MELVKTHQVNRYIAAQGPMQHTSRDFWQVNCIEQLVDVCNCWLIWVKRKLMYGLCIHTESGNGTRSR